MQSVLVVDDQPTLCSVLVRMLRDAGFDADAALDGSGALNSVRSRPPSLVLLDMMMPPGPGGLDVLRAIRMDPQARAVPVVVYSADGDPAARQAALAGGANDYLVKSVATFDDLRTTVSRYASAAAPPRSAANGRPRARRASR